MDEFERLWELVQLIHPSSPLPAATLQLELDQYRDKLLKLFQNQVGCGGSRAVMFSRHTEQISWCSSGPPSPQDISKCQYLMGCAPIPPARTGSRCGDAAAGPHG